MPVPDAVTAALLRARDAVDAALVACTEKPESPQPQAADAPPVACVHQNLQPLMGGYAHCRDCGTTVVKEATK